MVVTFTNPPPVRQIRLLKSSEWMHGGELTGYRRLCGEHRCIEPAFYRIRGPHASGDYYLSDRCADHALRYARRWNLPFPGLRQAAA